MQWAKACWAPLTSPRGELRAGGPEAGAWPATVAGTSCPSHRRHSTRSKAHLPSRQAVWLAEGCQVQCNGTAQKA